MSREIKIGMPMCTKIEAIDEPEYGANHAYEISIKLDNSGSLMSGTSILFQKGPVNEVGHNGIHNEDLIKIVIDRLKCFEAGKLHCYQNLKAIAHLTNALEQLNKRTLDRKERHVEGTSKQ